MCYMPLKIRFESEGRNREFARRSTRTATDHL